jgi:hypothetical protein
LVHWPWVCFEPNDRGANIRDLMRQNWQDFCRSEPVTPVAAGVPVFKQRPNANPRPSVPRLFGSLSSVSVPAWLIGPQTNARFPALGPAAFGGQKDMGALSRHVAVGAVKITVQDLPVPPFPVSARHCIAPRETHSPHLPLVPVVRQHHRLTLPKLSAATCDCIYPHVGLSNA